MILKIIQEELEKAEYVTQLYKADEAITMDRVTCFLELEGKTNEEGQILELMLVPDVKDELDGFEILQYFVTFEFDFSDCPNPKLQKIRNIIEELNYSLAIGSYGIQSNDDTFVYFKYRQMISPSNDIRKDNQVGLTASLIHFQIEQAYAIFEGILNAD